MPKPLTRQQAHRAKAIDTIYISLCKTKGLDKKGPHNISEWFDTLENSKWINLGTYLISALEMSELRIDELHNSGTRSCTTTYVPSAYYLHAIDKAFTICYAYDMSSAYSLVDRRPQLSP